MATNKNTKTKDPEKTVDVPPHGSRNPDPITDTAGSHPVETGIGAVIGGAASGLAVGSVGGPVGAVIGAIAGGAAAGGLAGKGVGELIDPTTEDNWLREYFDSTRGGDRDKVDDAVVRATHDTDDHMERYRPAYRYGMGYGGQTGSGIRPFAEAETDLRSEWEKSHAQSTGLKWDEARGAVKNAYDRTLQLHEERLRTEKHQRSAGDVEVRKEVITEHKTVQVPVEREEVVITRKPVAGKAAAGDIRAEEIRIPVKEETVEVKKETVLKEEVSVGKRKVTDTQTVEADLKREEVKVENRTTGSARVVDEKDGR